PFAHLVAQGGRLSRGNCVGTFDESDLMDLRQPFLTSVHSHQCPIEVGVVVAGHTKTDLIVAALGGALFRIGLAALPIHLEHASGINRVEAGHRHDPLGVARDASYESESARHRRSALCAELSASFN